MRCNRSIKIGFYLLLAFVLFANNSSAQEAKGSISGTITDDAGAVIPGAKVTAKLESENNQFVRTVVSNADGEYSFSDIPTGIYEITVDLIYGMSYRNKNLSVSAEQPTKLEIKLEYGGDCESTSGKTIELSETDKAEIVNQILEDSLGVNKIADYGLLTTQKGAIILSTENIKSELVKPLKNISLKLMSESEISEKANKEGDFLYLSFDKFKVKGECVIVTISNTWAVAIDSGKGYLSGGGSIYLYRKESGKLVGKSIGGWIS